MVNNTFCPRCKERFFTAYLTEETQCPYCAFNFKLIGYTTIRSCKRLAVDAICRVTKGELKFKAQVFDLSEGGVGIQTIEDLPCEPGEILHVSIEEHNIGSDAQVIWKEESDNCLSRAGLQFT